MFIVKLIPSLTSSFFSYYFSFPCLILQVSKENFWHVGKNEAKKDLWFKDLGGTKPLERLSQSVPIFNILREKDEVFVNLCKFNVPTLRAAWYIKMNHQYLVTYLANPSRKNKEKDPSQVCHLNARRGGVLGMEG